MNSHYIYLHRILLGNKRRNVFDIFYVGQGKGLVPIKGVYASKLKGYAASRAFQYQAGRRSTQWLRTTRKYGYIVEILSVGLTKEEVDKKECELIAYYGMLTLINKTTGGEGAAGVVVTKETREKLRKATSARVGRAVRCTTTGEVFETTTHAANWLLRTGKSKSLQSGQAGIGKVCLGHLSGFRGFGFEFLDGSTPLVAKPIPLARNMSSGKGVNN